MDEKKLKLILSQVLLPDTKKNIIDAKLVENIKIAKEEVSFNLVLDKEYPYREEIKKDCIGVLQKQGIKEVFVNLVSHFLKDRKISSVEAVKSPQFIHKENLQNITRIIPVYSTKGGVGKSTVSANLAVGLAKKGYTVGILDLDIYGPSIPRIFGVTGPLPVQNGKMLPLEKYGVKILSIGFALSNKKDAIIWRSPVVMGIIQQFLEDVEWGQLDYLILDMPPGTGDLQITVMQNLPLDGVIYVSTPQKIALDDTIRGIQMMQKFHVKSLGMILNMSYVIAPQSQEKVLLYSNENTLTDLKSWNIDVIGELPFVPQIANFSDLGHPFMLDYKGNLLEKEVINKAIEKIEDLDY